MISPTAAKKLGKDLGNHPVGTGPFHAQGMGGKGDHITVERNPNYWEKGKPYLDRIVFRDIAGSIVGVQRLATGELGIVKELSPQDILQFQQIGPRSGSTGSLSAAGIRCSGTCMSRHSTIQNCAKRSRTE